ncbi:MAG: hypothetical protein OEV59_02560 [Deltaproteobacteria bacterium]|nr:hypothetical protein [Deltaproteobacteria bacterium]
MISRVDQDKVKAAFVDALKIRGFELFKRSGFFKWMDQEVYLAQSEDLSGVMFIRAESEEKDGTGWMLNEEMFVSFRDMAAEDKDTGLYVVLLENEGNGFLLNGEEFDGVREGFKKNDKGNYFVDRNVIREKFLANSFAKSEEFFLKLNAAHKGA